MSARTRLLTMRMSPGERKRLDDVADHYGISCAEVIRMLLANELREIEAKQAAAPRR